MLSKALVVGAYQRKCELIAAHPDVQLTVLVPPAWRTGGQISRLEHAHTNGYSLREVPIVLNGNFHLHFYPTLRREMQRLRPDIVHIDEEPYNLSTYLALRAARSLRAKTVFFTWQNLRRTYPPPFNMLENYVLTHSDYALAGNREAVDVLHSKGYRGALSVIPQFGVDPTLFQPHESPPRAHFRIGYAGRLVREKGVDILLRALVGLPTSVQLDVVGTGDQLAPLQQLTAQLKLGERVHFLGNVPSTQMPAHYASLDVLVLPSRTQPNWKEQFGRVLIEAMSSAVPVVGSTCGEIPNVIGEAGLVFAEGDPDHLRECLLRLITYPTLHAELAVRGRARVLELYTMQRIADETVSVYRSMLQKLQ